MLRGYSHLALLGWDLPHARRTPHPLDLGYDLEAAPFWVSGGRSALGLQKQLEVSVQAALSLLFTGGRLGGGDWALEVRVFEMQMLLPKGHSHTCPAIPQWLRGRTSLLCFLFASSSGQATSGWSVTVSLLH